MFYIFMWNMRVKIFLCVSKGFMISSMLWIHKYLLIIFIQFDFNFLLTKVKTPSLFYNMFLCKHRAIPVIGNSGLEGLETATFPRRPPISLSLLNLLENSEGSRRSTEVLSESSSMDRLHSRQASLEANQSPLLPKYEALDALYAKVGL